MVETQTLVLLFFAVLTAFTLFVLWMGSRSLDEGWADDQGEASGASVALASPGLFAPLETPTDGLSADAMVHHLEERGRSENRAAAQFVEQPTVEHLHEGTLPVVERLVRDLETYLHDEFAAVRAQGRMAP